MTETTPGELTDNATIPVSRWIQRFSPVRSKAWSDPSATRAPGILPPPARALARLAERIGPELITLCLKLDERVMRMGSGTLDAVKTLRVAGIEVRATPGLRTGLMIVDAASSTGCCG